MKRKRGERGATMAEAAVTILVLFTFLFAILEFGRAFNMYQVMTDAAREGARYSVAPNPVSTPVAYAVPDTDAVTQRVCSHLQAANVNCAQQTSGGSACPATINQRPAANLAAGVYVYENCSVTLNNGVAELFNVVDVAAPYRFMFFPFGSINLRTRAVMRNENSQ